jgi:L-iditol 2-dehydrogenase
MRANLLIKPGVLALRDITIPEPSPGEILVKVKASLTCGTDVKTFVRGHPMIPMPTVFGHEFSGVIEKTGRGMRKFRKGMEIMAVHSAPCESILLPEHVVRHHVFKKPKNLSFPEAAFLEPLSCVMHSINSTGLFRRDTAVIIGAGAIGLLHLLVLKSMGLKVIVIEKQRARLKNALGLQADVAINPDRKQPLKKIKAATENIGADIVFECTGNPDAWEKAVLFVRKGGTVILFGGCKEGTKVCYDAGRVHYDEITLKGVFHYRPSDVNQAYQMLTKRKINVKKLISKEYPLVNLDRALRKLISGEGIKYAIIP